MTTVTERHTPRETAMQRLGRQTVEFFAIDTTPLGWRTKDAEQLKWLEGALKKSTARWKVVFGHHPLYSHSKRPYNATLIRRLEPLFVKHKVDLYVAGHDDPEALNPQVHVHFAEALPWLHMEDGLRRFPASGDGDGIGA